VRRHLSSSGWLILARTVVLLFALYFLETFYFFKMHKSVFIFTSVAVWQASYCGRLWDELKSVVWSICMVYLSVCTTQHEHNTYRVLQYHKIHHSERF
jgi:hypothetical protein